MQHKLCCVNLTKLVWYNMKNMVEVGQHEKRLIEHPCTLYIPYGESHHEMREGSENKYARPPSFSPHCPPCHAVKSPLAHINVWVRSLETWYIGIAYWERIFFPPLWDLLALSAPHIKDNTTKTNTKHHNNLPWGPHFKKGLHRMGFKRWWCLYIRMGFLLLLWCP